MNNSSNKLKMNIAYNVVFQILNIIVPLFTAPYVFRILGKEGIGIYGYTFSIAHYFSLFCMLGILNYGNREISMVSDDREKCSMAFWQIYGIQFIAGIISIITYIAVVSQLKSDYYDVFLIQGIIVISSMFDICWFFFGIENFRFTTIISMLNKVLTTSFIFLLVKSPNHVPIYTGIIAVGSLLNVFVYWIFLKRYVYFKIEYIKHLSSHIKPILLLFIPVIAINIYKYIDKIMLGMMLNVSEVGTFEAAEKLQNLPMCLIAAFGTVMLPRISNMTSKNEESAIHHYNKLSFILVMFLTIGMAFGLAGIANVFIPIFYGTGYEDSELVLLLLLPSMVFVGWANIIRTQYLLPRKMDSIFCSSVIAGAMVNIMANIIFIPLYGAVGAAISTTIAEFTVCLYQSIISFKPMGLKESLIDSMPFLAIGLVMCLCIMHIFLNNNIVTVVIRLVAGGVLYVGMSLFVLKRNIPIRVVISKRKKGNE